MNDNYRRDPRSANAGRSSAGYPRSGRPADPRSQVQPRTAGHNSRPQCARPQQGRPQAARQNPSARTGRPQGVQPRSVNRSPYPQQSRMPRKKGGNPVLKAVKIIGMGILAMFAAIFGVFGKLNRKLDVFRRSETSAVIVNCILGGVAVVILLCVFMLFKPDIDASRARNLAEKGESAAAVRLVHALENDGYDHEKLTETRKSVVQGLISSGEYDAADSLLSEMPDGGEKVALEKHADYSRARKLYEDGDYTAAAQLFYQMDDYQDSALRYADCRCALAIEAWQQGDENGARSLLLDVPDAVQRVNAAALKVTGSETAAQAVLSAELFSEASLTRMEQSMEELNAARSDVPQARIAAGRYHTIAVKRDGTLLCAGDNSMGQLNLTGWSGITQVAAGAYHSVGLRSDGTVLATGDNSQGQCEVSGWTDIVAVAAGTADTIGLKADGSVVACGKNSAKVTGWRDASFVTAGSYSMGCLYNGGSMLSSHPGAQMGMGVKLYDLSVCGPVSVGVLYDGSVTSSFDGMPQWTDMVSVTACESGILGIDVNGRVQSHFYHAGDAVDFNFSGEAVEVESSGTHHVVLTGDGKVYAYGNNDYGQCEVSGWQL